MEAEPTTLLTVQKGEENPGEAPVLGTSHSETRMFLVVLRPTEN